MVNQFFKRIRKDIRFRIKLFLQASIVFNIAYAVWLLVTSQILSSKWFFALSIYYALLSSARIFIYAQIQSQKPLRANVKAMRTCGFFLLGINLAVSTMMFILIDRFSIQYHEITVITLATYTFSSLSVAIVGNVKHFKRNDYVYSCAKMLSLISASVSLVTLTNTMLLTFGEPNSLLRSILLPILSGVVSVFIIICAIFMIHKANSSLRILKNEKDRQ